MDNKKNFRSGSNKGGNQRRGYRNVGFVVLVILFLFIVLTAIDQPSSLTTIPISQAIADQNHGDYSTLNVNGDEIDITKTGASTATLKAYKDPNSSLKAEGFNLNKSTVEFKPASSSSSVLATIGESLLPVILISLVLYFMLRSAQGQGNQALSFGKSRARLYGKRKR